MEVVTSSIHLCTHSIAIHQVQINFLRIRISKLVHQLSGHLSRIYYMTSIHCKFSQYLLQSIHCSCASRGRMAIQTEKLVLWKQHTGSTIYTIFPNAGNDAVGEKRDGV